MLTGEVAARRAGPEPKSTLSHDLWLVSRLPQPLLRRLKQLQPFLHPEVYDLNRDRLLSLMAVGIFLFLFIKGRIGNNRDAAVPITQTLPTPISRPTVTSAFEVNPTVASFGSNFDVTDRVIPSTGERFSADVRDRALRLEAVGRGARGKVMFNAAPATADFHFTVQVGETTGQGEILIYVRKPDSERTWVFAIDPGASTWGLYEEPPWSNRPISVLDHIDYSSAIAGEPLRTITVTRKGGRTSLLINGATVSPRVAGSMPRIGGPVTVGIGAMIPDDPEYDESEPFVVTIDRVAMHADEP